MSVRPLAFVAAVALLLGASDAEAWPWSRKGHKKRMPKPIDFPIVREKVPEHHKPGNTARHSQAKKYDRQEWGAEWGKTLDTRRRHVPHPWVTGRDE